MARRTIYLPDSTAELVENLAEPDESFSAAVARLIEAGARAISARPRPRYVASGDGPEELGRLAESYLNDLARGT